MDNQRIKGLITGWRSMEDKLRDNTKNSLYSDSEAWVAANTIYQCIGELEALILVDEYTQKEK